jgi:hypothetical protein
MKLLAAGEDAYRARRDSHIIHSPATKRLVAYTEPQNREQNSNRRESRSHANHLTGIRSCRCDLQIVNPSNGERRWHLEKDQEQRQEPAMIGDMSKL